MRRTLNGILPECELRSADTRAGVQAVRLPSVILLDLTLSDDPAFAALRWLREADDYKDTPVFVLGSEILDRDVTEAYALGANGCLLKESDPERLLPIAQGIAAYASLLPVC